MIGKWNEKLEKRVQHNTVASVVAGHRKQRSKAPVVSLTSDEVAQQDIAADMAADTATPDTAGMASNGDKTAKNRRARRNAKSM